MTPDFIPAAFAILGFGLQAALSARNARRPVTIRLIARHRPQR